MSVGMMKLPQKKMEEQKFHGSKPPSRYSTIVSESVEY